MPASLRAHVSRGMASSSSRPYDRRSPTASSAQSANPLAHPHLSRGQPPAPFVQAPDPDPVDPDTPPDHPGLPTYAEYKRIEAGYLHSLSPRKRDKALVTQAMFDKIWDVLHQPDACTIETPQFRFWVRKMFSLSRPMYVGVQGDASWGEVRAGGTYPDPDSDSDAEGAGLELERAMGIEADASADLFGAVVLHENRPVAIMEQLYELFCYCHVRARHGGRDKTCAVIRQHYSWVPKELTAQFVKACPTCALKRSGHGGVSVDMGVLVQRRVVGQRERRVYGTPGLSGGEMPVSAVPSSLGWPMTGGPLDPANPEPCGVRERERERAWLRVHEGARTIDPPSLSVSPARVSVDASSRTRTVPREVPLESCLSSGWSGVPQGLTADTSPFRSAVGITGRHENTRGNHGSTRTGLPSLASALSNESLDESVNLTGLGPETAGECLPPVLRPLRLLGPMIPSDTESDMRPPPSESSLFQIDPALLSFNYPGLGLSESGSASFGARAVGGVVSSWMSGSRGEHDVSWRQSLSAPAPSPRGRGGAGTRWDVFRSIMTDG
ncbi:hypothetical protein J3R82DRAFT_9037 [Butyriboletus roseoflavus]|nr:hypothetical protein J3R82DRAFT_9037 [Butyriboletus roseoflavus]